MVASFRGRSILGVWSENRLFIVVVIKYSIVVFISVCDIECSSLEKEGVKFGMPQCLQNQRAVWLTREW